MNNGLFDIRGRQYATITVADVVFYDLICGNPVIKFDTLTLSTVEQSSTQTNVQGGKGNPILAVINSDKVVNLTLENALMSMGYLSVITGGEITKSGDGKKVTISTNEVVTATAEGIELKHAMPGGSTLWLAELTNGIISERKARYDAPAGSSAQDITLADANWKPSTYTIEAGKTYQVFYTYELTEVNEASELTVFADKFSKTYRMVGDTELYNTATGRNEAFQIEVPRLDLDDSYTLTLSAAGEAATFNLSGTALADDQKRLIIYRLYDEEGSAIEEDCLLKELSV